MVECSYASPIHPDPFPQLRVAGRGNAAGSLRLDPGYRLSVFSNGVASEIDVSPTMLPWSTPPWHGTQESVLRVQRHWVRCLREKREPETSGADSLKTYGLVFGAYMSARPENGRRSDGLTGHLRERTMSGTGAKIGLSADLFDTHGRPMFGAAPLSLFSDAGLAWDVIPVEAGRLPPAAFTEYDALLIGGSKVSEKELGERERSASRDRAQRRWLRRDRHGGAHAARHSSHQYADPGAEMLSRPTAVAFILALKPPHAAQIAPRCGRVGGASARIIPGLPAGPDARNCRPWRDRARARSPHAALRNGDPGRRSPCRSAAAAEVDVELCNLEELMTRSDFVVVACLLNKATHHLLNAGRIRLMKPTAYLINVARGPIIDEDALIAALQDERIAGAGPGRFREGAA